MQLGVQAGLTIVAIGSNATAGSTTNVDADLISWARSKGAYGGITLEGAVIQSRPNWNTEYYGHSVSPRHVLGIA